jgi:acyl-CoA thioester hydrolase
MAGKRKLLHSLTIDVRWGDLNARGRVNGAVYYSYCEQARAGWLANLGAIDALSTSTQGPRVVQFECSFLKPVGFPAKLQVDLYGATPGKSGFKSLYEIRDQESERLCFTASAQIVWVDRELESSVTIPEVIRRLLPAKPATSSQDNE